MVIVTKSLDEMMQEVECIELTYFEYWMPIGFPERHRTSEIL